MADAPFTFLPFGALLQTFNVGGINIVQGFNTQDEYVEHNTQHFGLTIGRVANRISNAKIDSLNGGKSYTLAANNGVNSLHGGPVGWGKRHWKGPEPVGVREIPGIESLQGGESVRFTILSEDGDEGFPGTVEASCVYTTGTQDVEGHEVLVLGIEYEARLVGDDVDETVINMTNHSYFNLTGGPSIEGTRVTLASGIHLPVDDGGIPTGGTKSYPGVEAGAEFVLGPREPDIDDCFVVNEDVKRIGLDTRSAPLGINVTAYHPESGVHLEVLSTEPAFQFYTGKYIEIPAIGGLPPREPRSGFCVEPSRYVNAVNVPEWKDMMVLKKGQTYGCRIVYRAWKA